MQWLQIIATKNFVESLWFMVCPIEKYSISSRKGSIFNLLLMKIIYVIKLITNAASIIIKLLRIIANKIDQNQFISTHDLTNKKN